MKKVHRKEFLQSAGVLLAAAFSGTGFSAKQQPLLSFSTLGCPDWPFEKIIDFAVQHGYKGLELRGIQREMDLPKCKEFITPGARKQVVQLMKRKRLQFVGLGSSATMHFAEATQRQKNLDEGRRFIDLAQDINCPYVRVFPNNFPKDQERQQTMDLITKGLLELAEHARGSKVVVLMETHGDLVKTADLEMIMQGAEHPHTGLVWDISNMWTVTKESPAEVYKRLKKYIRHVHIKDAGLRDDKLQYKLLGEGEVPIFEGIDLLAGDGYQGFYSFEWEKLWHPEILEPEIALADYPVKMKTHFKKL
jgi:sugar phosphate isomerase/epimerase